MSFIKTEHMGPWTGDTERRGEGPDQRGASHVGSPIPGPDPVSCCSTCRTGEGLRGDRGAGGSAATGSVSRGTAFPGSLARSGMKAN